MGKFCEREQNYFWLSLYVTKDSFYPSKKVGLRPTFLEGLPDSSLTKWENFVNGNKIIFGWLSIALWSNYSIYSDLLDWTWKWENFVNGNKIIFGWVYEVGTKKKPGKNPIRFAHCFARFARYAAPAGLRPAGAWASLGLLNNSSLWIRYSLSAINYSVERLLLFYRLWHITC